MFLEQCRSWIMTALGRRLCLVGNVTHPPSALLYTGQLGFLPGSAISNFGEFVVYFWFRVLTYCTDEKS